MFDDAGAPAPTEPDRDPTPAGERPAATDPAPAAAPEEPGLARFRSCRWHDEVEGAAEYCSHRDVLPYAGKNGFSPKAWCPDCTFYKVRRTVKRRTQDLGPDDY